MSRIDFQTLRDGRVAVITINRPEAHNALDKDAQDGLHAAFDRFAADDGLWVAILTGAGSAAFCAGHDLKSPAPEGPADLPTSGFGGVTARFDLDKPVIAAVNGAAMGGGFEMALACDIVVASETASFALPEARVGLAALGGGLLRLPRVIGLQRAMGLMLTGRRVSAAEGHDLGFVTEVVAPDAVMEAALRWADALLAVSPLAARAAKQVVQQLAALPLAQASALQWTLPAVQTMQTSADRGEGMAAFVDRRPPVWSGR
jgi:crotonobetainyl-CoA hydratase